MATRYYITLGATTTAGGTVTSASSLLSLNGVKVALEGDRVSCPFCGAVATIGLDGPRMQARDSGMCYALSNDLCLCYCDPPPRLVAVQVLSSQTS